MLALDAPKADDKKAAAAAAKTYPETTLLATTRFAFEEHLEGLSNVSYCWKAGG